MIDIHLLDFEIGKASVELRSKGYTPAFVHLTQDEWDAIGHAWRFSLVHPGTRQPETYMGLRPVIHKDTPVLTRVTD